MGAGPDTMLYWIALVAREARESKDRHQVHIAAELRLNQATVRRFEQAQGWPRDPDAMIAAYARDLDMQASDLWDEAVRRWLDASLS